MVTRPAKQAASLCHLIEGAGAQVRRFPLLEIADVEDNAALDSVLARLGRYHLAIFISANAVERGLARLAQQGGWPPGPALAAVGRRTAEALARHGLGPVMVPTQYDSEGLLALPDLQSLNGRSVVIFRGEGGREQLAEQLRARGARVDYAEVYRRVCPAPSASTLSAVAAGVDVIIVSSNQALDNLHALLDSEKLRATPLVVASARNREHARELGFSAAVSVAADATDEAMLAALYRQEQ